MKNKYRVRNELGCKYDEEDVQVEGEKDVD